MKADTVEGIADDSQIYIPIQSIHLGGATKVALQQLLNQGHVSQRDYDSVLKAAQAYFKAALNYVLEKFPTTNDTLLHAKWIDVGKRADAKWESVKHLFTSSHHYKR